MNLSTINNQLDKISDLEDGYDGYGGVKPNHESITGIRNFLKSYPFILEKVISVSPCPNGEVQIEINPPNIGKYLEIEFETPYSGIYLAENGKDINVARFENLGDLEIAVKWLNQ